LPRERAHSAGRERTICAPSSTFMQQAAALGAATASSRAAAARAVFDCMPQSARSSASLQALGVEPFRRRTHSSAYSNCTGTGRSPNQPHLPVERYLGGAAN
jgi:hypothetical protein